MPPDTIPYPRRLFAHGGNVNLVSFVVGGVTEADRERLAKVVVSAERLLPPGVSLLVRDGSDPGATAWFRGILEATEPPNAQGITEANSWLEFAGHTEDGPSLEPLAATWGAIRCLLGEIAPYGAVWDGLSLMWSASGEVLSLTPDDLRLAASWRCEAVHGFRDVAGVEYVCVHSLGLAKFGRRDLLAFGSADNLGTTRALVSGLGADLVQGAVLRAGDLIEKGGLRMQIEVYQPGKNAPELDVPFVAPPFVLTPV